jgi:hypothetical protein
MTASAVSPAPASELSSSVSQKRKLSDVGTEPQVNGTTSDPENNDSSTSTTADPQLKSLLEVILTKLQRLVRVFARAVQLHLSLSFSQWNLEFTHS